MRTVLLAAMALGLLAACGPPPPARLDVAADGVRYEGATYTCLAPLMARLDKLDREQAVEIVPAGTGDNFAATRVEASVEAKGFKRIGMTLATGKGAWSTYPPVAANTELNTCRAAGSSAP